MAAIVQALQKPGAQIAILVTVVGVAMGGMLIQKFKRPAEVTEGKTPPSSMGQQAPEKITLEQNDDSPQAFQATLDKLSLPRAKEPEPVVQVMSADDRKKADKGEERKELPSLVMVEKRQRLKDFKARSPQIFAPRGMLIKATLVLTVDSSNIDTPVLALVTEDVYWDGNLIVPSGTQVHASAASGRMRDRIAVEGTYTFVWDDGREYKINAVGLDHQILEDGTFSLTDGSAGIRGEVLKTDNYAELKLIIAEVVSGLSKNSQDTVASVFGPVPDNTLSNSGFEGVSEAGDRYAELLMNRIEDDLEYVRVVAGTEFYIFTLDVFEPELASVGGIVQGNEAKSSWQLAQEEYEKELAREQSLAPEIPLSERATAGEEARIRREVQGRNDYIDRVRTILESNQVPASQAASATRSTATEVTR